ncbi:unnamed protein product [Phytophthora lilii]|uniref:Unnamed protein product n=1 Tax=Phytophthora lilii TaxID=2077276 RepID=A0A9W6X535_9STRA|nr:unnamed protein product [Phytophthora lilii]
MIVPVYWNASKKDVAPMTNRKLFKRKSVLSKYPKGWSLAKWEYSLPVDVSKAVFANFVVKCYRPGISRKVRSTFLEVFVMGSSTLLSTSEQNTLIGAIRSRMK